METLSGGGSSGPAETGLDNTPRLTDANAAFYNSSLFAIKVKKSCLFTDGAITRFRNNLVASSQLDPLVTLLPTNEVEPSFVKPNMVFFRPYRRHFMDRLMPITMCVTKTPLFSEVNRIYGQNDGKEGVYEVSKAFCESLAAHTATPFPTPEPALEGLSNSLEDTDLQDDEALLVYTTVYNLINMLANGDTVVRFSKETECKGGDVSVGEDGVPALKIYSIDKFSNQERYPVDAAAAVSAKRVVAHSPIIMREYRCLIRQMLKFGNGDTGEADDRTEENDTEFESRLWTTVMNSAPAPGKGAAGLVAANLQLNAMVNTIVPIARKKEIVGTPEVVWSMYVVGYLGAFSAMSISHITVSDGKNNRKMPRFHMKACSPLTNLQTTASRESKTTCGLVMFLAQKLTTLRTVATVCNTMRVRCRGCASCDSGDYCAHHWMTAFTSYGALADSLTSGQATKAPSSTSFNLTFVADFNKEGSLFGNISDKDNHDRRNTAAAYIQAHAITVDAFKDRYRPSPSLPDREVFTSLCKLVTDAREYVHDARHKQALLPRADAKAKTINSVLTDNDGGVSKLSLGFMSMMASKSKLMMYLARLCMVCDCKLDGFAENPAKGVLDMVAAVGSKNVGVYIAKKDQDKVNMQKVYIHPVVDPETDEVMDVTSQSKSGACDVAGVCSKSTSKIKHLNGVLKAPANDGSGAFHGGMDFGDSSAAGGSIVLSPEQKAALRVGLSWLLVRSSPNFKIKRFGTAITRLMDEILATPMSQFNTNELPVAGWDNFLSLYVAGLLLTTNGFYIKPNKAYAGMTVPKYAQLMDEKTAMIEPVSRVFLNGAAIVYGRVTMGAFEVMVNSAQVKYVSANMSPFAQLSMFTGNNMMAMANRPCQGVFIPIKMTYGTGDSNGVCVDALCDEITQLATRSPSERCFEIKKNAAAYMDKIRQMNRLAPEDPITIDHVTDLFAAYSADVLLDNPDVREIAENMSNPDVMNAVYERALAKDQKDGADEEEDFDFNEHTRPADVAMADDDVAAGDKDDLEARKTILASFRD